MVPTGVNTLTAVDKCPVGIHEGGTGALSPSSELALKHPDGIASWSHPRNEKGLSVAAKPLSFWYRGPDLNRHGITTVRF